MPQPLEIPFPAAVWIKHLEDDGARIPASKRPVQRGAAVLMERLGDRVFLVGRRAHRITERLSASRALSIVNGRLRLRREPIEQRWHPPGRPAADLAAIRKAAGPPGGPPGWSVRIARSTHTGIFSPRSGVAKAAGSEDSQAAETAV